MSLAPDAEAVRREDAVFEVVARSPRPLGDVEIASHLYGSSPAYVRALVRRLAATGRLVHVDGRYLTAERAFRGVDQAALAALIGDLLDEGTPSLIDASVT